MTLYVENPKDSTKTLLELIHEFSKVAGCKTHAQKSIAFLNTNNEPTVREIRKSIPFTSAPKLVKYPQISITKQVKNQCTENYRKLIQDLKKAHKKMAKCSILLDGKNKDC